MAMNLRTTDQQTEALRQQAEREGRSMQAVALSAIDEYIAGRARTERLDGIAQAVAARHSRLLKRLGEA